MATGAARTLPSCPSIDGGLASWSGEEPKWRDEPRYPWRLLEQQRQELPGRVPEQERARQPEQQSGFPSCPSS